MITITCVMSWKIDFRVLTPRAAVVHAVALGVRTRKSIFQDITQVIVIKQTIEHDF